MRTGDHVTAILLSATYMIICNYYNSKFLANKLPYEGNIVREKQDDLAFTQAAHAKKNWKTFAN